ncbi:MAG: ABC transporter permease subunit [Rubrobacteraceae bacterium]
MSTTAERTSAPPATPRLAETLASEWTKLWTLRFIRAMLALALVLSAGASAIFLLTTGVTRGGSLAEMNTIDVAGTSLLGVDFANLVLIILCASAVASEYSTGMIRLTLAATPRRLRVLAAKATVLAVTALTAGVLSAVVTFGVGQIVLVVQGVSVMDPADPRLLKLVLGSALMVPFYSLLAVAFAFITRSAGWAIAAVLAIMSVPALVGALPEWWREFLLPGLPASALHCLSGSASPSSPEYLAPVAATLVLLVWAAGLLLAAYVSFAKRDA